MILLVLPTLGICALPLSAAAAAKHKKMIAAQTSASTKKSVAVKAQSKPSAHKTKRPAAVQSKRLKSEPVSAERAQALEEERAALRDKLATLRRDIAASESTRSEVSDALAHSERAISDVNRKLHELTAQQDQVQESLADIGQRRSTTQSTIAAQQAQLGQLLVQQYQTEQSDPFKLLFSGDDPNQVQRNQVYLHYVAEARAQLLQSLQGNLDQLQKISAETAARDAELSAIAQAQEQGRDSLLKQQQAKRETLAKIADKLDAQRHEADVLERDDKRLAHVVDELAKVLARQAQEAQAREKKLQERERQQARERQRQEQQQARATGHETPKPVKPQTEPETDKTVEPEDKSASNDLTPLAGFTGNFGALKGRLRLPVRGDLLAHFGKVRAEGGPSWKGVFIRAANGAEVKAIAPGRVVFAEWLRGFGNLMIVDHGSQYLSIYGNNETLLKTVGATVQSGEVIATVGNSGGNAQSGLYFELRFQGRPFDPLSWATLK